MSSEPFPAHSLRSLDTVIDRINPNFGTDNLRRALIITPSSPREDGEGTMSSLKTFGSHIT